MHAATLSYVVCTWLLAAGAPSAGGSVAPRENLDVAVPIAIRLLEAKHYEIFLQYFVEPETLKKLTKDKPLSQAAKEFGEKESPQLLSVLKMIRGTRPTMDRAGTTATYKLKEAIAGKKTLVWTKKDKYWYLQN